MTKYGFPFGKECTRHAAILMTHMCADITYDSDNTYIHKTLTTESIKRGDIRGLANIENFFNGTSDASLHKTELTITAFIPTMEIMDIGQIMALTQQQRQFVSENKINSAVKTLAMNLQDWLTICVTLPPLTKVQAEIRPQVTQTTNLQTHLTEEQYRKIGQR
jgi:hypothetical protein